LPPSGGDRGEGERARANEVPAFHVGLLCARRCRPRRGGGGESGTVEPSSLPGSRSAGRAGVARAAFVEAAPRVPATCGARVFASTRASVSTVSEVGIPGYFFLLLFCLILPYLVLKASLKT